MTIYTGKPVEKKDDELESGVPPPEVVEEPLMVNIRVQLVCVCIISKQEIETMSELGLCCAVLARSSAS